MSSIFDRIELLYAQFVRELTYFPKGKKRTNINHALCQKFIQDIHDIAVEMPNTLSQDVDPKIFEESVAVLEYLEPKAAKEEGMIAVIKQTKIVLFLLYKVYYLVLENEKLKAENAKFLEKVRTLEARYQRDSFLQLPEAPLKDLGITGELPSSSVLEKNEEIQTIMHSDAFKYSVISILSIFASKGFIILDVSNWQAILESNYQSDSLFMDIFAQIEGNFSKMSDEEEMFQIVIQKLFAEDILINVKIVNSFILTTFGTITYQAFPHFMIGGLVASVIYIAFTNSKHAAEYAKVVLPIISFIKDNYPLK